MPIDPSTAFVSYSREDIEFVLRLAKDLKAKGSKVWMDKLDIHPGQRWEAEIETAVEACSRMLVVLSPAAIVSENVLAEASLAIDDGKEVVPVLYRECRVPFRLRPFQYADFRTNYDEGLEELVSCLDSQLAGAEKARLDESQRQAVKQINTKHEARLVFGKPSRPEVRSGGVATASSNSDQLHHEQIDDLSGEVEPSLFGRFFLLFGATPYRRWEMMHLRMCLWCLFLVYLGWRFRVWTPDGWGFTVFSIELVCIAVLLVLIWLPLYTGMFDRANLPAVVPRMAPWICWFALALALVTLLMAATLAQSHSALAAFMGFCEASGGVGVLVFKPAIDRAVVASIASGRLDRQNLREGRN